MRRQAWLATDPVRGAGQEIERKLTEHGACPILFYLQNANCSPPQVKGPMTMANSVYNSWLFGSSRSITDLNG
jgi:hypothetical protein